MPKMGRPGSTIPMSERECQDAVMDLAPDGSIWLVFRREFAIWATQRSTAGEWTPPERVVREYVFHPSIMVAHGRPLITFQHEGVRSIPLDIEGDISKRGGGGSTIGYATRTEEGWRIGPIARAEEIPVFRRGMWEKMYRGRIYSQIEQFGWPVMFRDPHGVVWALWQNTTRRWAYSARWMGEGFGPVQECRGPFNAPGLPVNAEKRVATGTGDVGMLFYAAAAGGNDRAIFDRLRIPSLSVAEDREVLFLDSLEVGATSGAELVLNQPTKPAGNDPVLSPRENENLTLRSPSVSRHGDVYVMRYARFPISSGLRPGHGSKSGVAISRDGVHFEKVDALPANFPPAETFPNGPLGLLRGSPKMLRPAYFRNPDRSDPQKKFMRLAYSTEQRGIYWVEYSSNGRKWTKGPQQTAAEAMRERARPNFYDPTDPERPIRIYSRVYTETGRSWGVIWTKDLVHWSRLEHLLDPDDPYRQPPAQSGIAATGKS